MTRPTSQSPDQSDANRETGAAADFASSSEPPDHDTLRPPEWEGPRSVSVLALERLSEERPISRRSGIRAEAAYLRGRLAECRALHDAEGERVAAVELARLLSRQGTELDAATHLARQALATQEDPRLRAELSAWYALIGEASLGAATLRPLRAHLAGPRAARVLIRTAVLQGRAGEPSDAATSLRLAAAESRKDPIPCELLGALHLWAPATVASREAAEAYLEGADRRLAGGDRAGAFEDLLRAFELAPELPQVTDRVVDALVSRGRTTAADEVLREHARVWGQRARAVHFRRYRNALGEANWGRALAASFDAGLDRAIVAEEVGRADHKQGGQLTFDGLLVRLGLVELRAARLVVAASLCEGALRTRCLLTLAEIYRVDLASYPRAVDTWLAALERDPRCEEALSLLRRYAEESGDFVILAEGLRVCLEQDPSLVGHARELLAVADERVGDPALAWWAARHLRDLGENTGVLSAEEWAERAELQAGALAHVRNRIAQAKGEDRVSWLRQLMVSLRGRPEQVDESISVMSELVEVTPDPDIRHELRRVLRREERWARLERLLQRDSRERSDPHAAIRLAHFHVARGQFSQALTAVAEPATEPAAERERAALALVLAAHSGNEAARAQALVTFGAQCSQSIYAELASVASDCFVEALDLESARSAAEKACHASPTSARPTLAFARASEGVHDRVTALALERAVGVVIPHSRWCRRLADTLEALGDAEAAMQWTQRWLALRPGDRDAARALLRRAVACGQSRVLGDSLAWLLAQAQPLSGLTLELCAALKRLSELDGDRGLAIARRLLDVFGARRSEIRDTVRKVARDHGERGLAIAVLERELATGVLGQQRLQRLLELAQLRGEGGDVDGGLRALARAVEEGAATSAVTAALESFGQARTTDGEISRLAVEAELASRGTQVEAAASAWRRYGAALWDLGNDRTGAIGAWERAATLDPEKGYEHLARDLVAFLGPTEAGRRLRALSDAQDHAKVAGRILVVAAAVALDGGSPREALSFALDALGRDPTRADALAITEAAARGRDTDVLAKAYGIAEHGVMGTFGLRSLHYRAARQFERRGEHQRALRHALRAFEAVPRQGVAYVLMMRLAQRLGETTEVVAALERVAEGATAKERPRWLEASATLSGGGVFGEHQRVDVLLRGLTMTPQADVVASLAEGMRSLIKEDPSETEAQTVRFQRAVDGLIARAALDVPEDALAQAARSALDVFGDVELALRVVDVLYQRHPQSEVFRSLKDCASRLATAKRPLLLFLERAERAVQGAPEAVMGGSAAELASLIAGHAGRDDLAVALLVAAALSPGADDDLINRAERAAHASGDANLLRKMQSAMPAEQRFRLLTAEIRRCEETDDAAGALQYLRQARDTEGASTAEVLGLQARVRAWLTERGDHACLAEDLRSELLHAREAWERAALLIQLTDELVAAGQLSSALEALSEALESDPDDHDLWRTALEISAASGDKPWQAESLSRLIDLTREPLAKVEPLRRLAALLVETGDEQGAVRRYTEWLQIQPEAAEAWTALQDLAAARRDWQGLCELLSKRLRSTQDPDLGYALQQQLARVLELRLGRPHAAREQMQQLLIAHPGDLSIMAHLADLTERLGDPLHAAQLWSNALAAAAEPSDVAQFAARACSAYLAGGDVSAAQKVLEARTAAQTERLCELRVEVARRVDDAPALADALEDMARHSTAPPRERASMWLESAQASLDAGHTEDAMKRAQRSAETAPTVPEAQILLEQLRYAERSGPGDATDATRTITALRGASGTMTPEQHARYAFLLAEALDVLGRHAEALEELLHAEKLHGEMPLIAVARAERASAVGSAAEALEFYTLASNADLLGLRSRGQVALGAAHAAHKAGDRLRALDFLQVAESLPESAVDAQTLRLEIQASTTQQPPSVAPVIPSEPPQSAGDSLETALIQESEAHYPTPAPRTLVGMGESPSEPPGRVSDLVTARPTSSASRPSLLGGGSIAPTGNLAQPALPRMGTSVSSDLLSLDPGPTVTVSRTIDAGAQPQRRPVSAPPLQAGYRSGTSDRPDWEDRITPVAPSFPTSEPPQLAVSASARPPLAHQSSVPRAATPVEEPAQRKERSSLPPGTGAPSRSLRQELALLSSSQSGMFRAVQEGDLAAAEQLYAQLLGMPTQTHELVSVCRQAWTHDVGDVTWLRRLRQAAEADQDRIYAQALLHVEHVLCDQVRIQPPPLSAQREGEGVRALLFRDQLGAVLQAVARVWAEARQLYRRELARYGLGLQSRIPEDGRSPLSTCFIQVVRVFGEGRTAVYVEPGEEYSATVLVVDPPGLLLVAPDKIPHLAFDLGAAIAMAQPELALAAGLGDDRLARLLSALQLAFGPPYVRDKSTLAAMNLAERLWETIPARSQRELRELCETEADFDPEAVRVQLRHLARRAGLIASGDLQVALDRVFADEGIAREQYAGPSGIKELCRKYPVARDLLHLATSPEYAEARWQPERRALSPLPTEMS